MYWVCSLTQNHVSAGQVLGSADIPSTLMGSDSQNKPSSGYLKHKYKQVGFKIVSKIAQFVKLIKLIIDGRGFTKFWQYFTNYGAILTSDRSKQFRYVGNYVFTGGVATTTYKKLHQVRLSEQISTVILQREKKYLQYK